MDQRPPAESPTSTEEPGSEAFVDKLRKALRRDGDFPASAKVVVELRALVSDPKTNANQIAELILKEPSLGTRILSLVNSSYYRRAKPIMTVSQAVLQIGMKPLAELCSGLVLLQKFIPMARRGGPFATCLQKTIVTALLSSQLAKTTGIASSNSKKDETGYLAGSFAELGPLLLAYYFPQIYESAAKRSEAKGVSLDKSIQDLTGLTPIELSFEVITALELPEFYRQVLSNAIDLKSASKSVSSRDDPAGLMGKAVSCSQEISQAIVEGKDQSQIDSVLSHVQSILKVDLKVITKSIGELPTLFEGHCSSLELDLPKLPEFVVEYSESASSKHAPSKSADLVRQDPQNQFLRYIEEIREAVDRYEPTASIITSVMEALAFGLSLDRVLLMLLAPGKKKLVGRMLLGRIDGFDPTKFERPLGGSAGPYAPDARAIAESRAVFTGDPLIGNGWPLAAIPVGFGPKTIGLIYADRSAGNKDDLDSREQAAIGLLAELLDKSISSH